MKGTINGWRYYRNAQGEMVAYYLDIEQLIFPEDKDFYKWLYAEKQEQLERYEDLAKLNWEDESEIRGAIEYHEEHLKLPYLDDQERNWTLSTIDRLKSQLDKLTGNESDWVKLFK